MHYVSSLKTKKWREEAEDRKNPPYKIVRKKIHGQWFDVKVYQPRWSMVEENEKIRLGLKEPNRFGRDRGDILERKCNTKRS